jgi:hypothetical protein
MPLSIFSSILNPNFGVNQNLLRQVTLNKTPTLYNNQVRSQNEIIRYKKIMCVASLIPRIVINTSIAIQTCQYQKFDALVGNFGCQITALQVQELMRTPDLYRIAANAREQARQALVIINNLNINDLTIPVGETNLLQLAIDNNFDCALEPCMVELVKLRLLSIVNDIKAYNNPYNEIDELPFTNCNKLNILQPIENAKNLIQTIVRNLKIDTSRQAISFLEAKGVNLGNDLVARLHKDTMVKDSIVFSNLTANMSIVARSINGIVVIANKLRLNNQLRVGAVPFFVYLKMPEQRILSPKEIRTLPDSEPIMYIEGYVRNADKLNAIIMSRQLIPLMIQNCSCLQADGSSKDPQRQSYINRYFKLDHLFNLNAARMQNLTAEAQINTMIG